MLPDAVYLSLPVQFIHPPLSLTYILPYLPTYLHQQLIDVFVSEEEHVLHLVLEFCTFDLEKVIRDKSILLRPPQIKKYALMLLEGIHWCHSHFVLHRGE
jgi:cyclin-dependent kinase 7